MKPIEIKEIKVSDILNMDSLDKYNYEQGLIYYIAYETSPTKPYSILFKDLKFIRKHFGVNQDESSEITHESLNNGRNNEIELYMKAIKHKVAIYDILNLQSDGKTFKHYATDKSYSLTVYKPNTISEESLKSFQAYVDRGLLILCKFV